MSTLYSDSRVFK